MDFKECKKKFDNDGYFKIKNFLNKTEISKIVEEIMKSSDVDIHKDNNNLIRRIERFYNKGEYLNLINKKFIELIKNILGLNVLIFKDKFNLKPPGGEGFKAHYDGVFMFVDPRNKKKCGWYEYGDTFINVLVAIDNCNEENGTIELAKSENEPFHNLIKKTKSEEIAELLDEVEKEYSFEKIILNVGDLVVFKNTCPHKSSINNSNIPRRILYYTYLDEKFGNQYENYFLDKKLSKNKIKS